MRKIEIDLRVKVGKKIQERSASISRNIEDNGYAIIALANQMMEKLLR